MIYVTFKQLAQFHPAFSESKLRWFWFKRQAGFVSCVLQIGRRLFIDKEQFEKWVNTHTHTHPHEGL